MTIGEFALYGAVTLGIGYYLKIMFPYWYKQGYKERERKPMPQQTEASIQQPQVKRATIPQRQSLLETKQEDSKQKGDAFEKYVVNLFNADSGRFRLKEWRSDKMADNGLYAQSNHLPDIEMAFVDGRKEHRFAIECKWRKAFYWSY